MEKNGVKIVIPVINENNQFLFKIGKITSDCFEAQDEFTGGQLSIIRQGEVLDQTSYITVQGGHVAVATFCGLKKLFADDTTRAHAAASLYANKFQEGDLLILELPIPEFENFGALQRWIQSINVCNKICNKMHEEEWIFSFPRMVREFAGILGAGNMITITPNKGIKPDDW